MTLEILTSKTRQDKTRQDKTRQDKTSEYRKLVKYFLAALTVPEKDLWVNLSPYEKDRIIPENFGKTEMGRDLLSQDYILKQLTASLMYPEKELGREFWQKIYKEAQERYGTTEIPVDTFNKVWIVADKASVYEHENTVFLVDSHLKVMLEQDYMALEHNRVNAESNKTDAKDVSSVSSQVIREVILPAIEKEVNEGKNFALLRQINNSLILAVWYKTALKESLLGKVYADRNKTDGVDQDIKNNQKIYEQYLEAFKKGVYNYIKEDYDPVTRETIPRKYFSGGYATEDPNLDNPNTPQNEGLLATRIETLDPVRDATVIEQAIQKASPVIDQVGVNLEESGAPGLKTKQGSSPLRNQQDLDREIATAIEAINAGQEPANARKYIKVKVAGILLAFESHKEKRYRPGSSLVTYVVDESGNLKDETWRPDGVNPTVRENTVILSNGAVKYPAGHALAGQEVKGRYNDDGTFVIDQENGSDVLQNEYLTDVDFVTNPNNYGIVPTLTWQYGSKTVPNYVIQIPADAEGDFLITTKSGTRINIKGGDYVVINTKKGKADGMQGVQAAQFDATYVDYAEYVEQLKKLPSAGASPLTSEEARRQLKAFLEGPNGSFFEAKMGAGRLGKAEPIAIELLRELHGKPLNYKVFDTTFTKGDITTEPEVTLTKLKDRVGRVELSTFMQVVFLRMLGVTQRPDIDSGESPKEETSDRITIGNTNVGIVQGDITEVLSDAVVPGVNTGMAVGMGVTGAIIRAVGYDNAPKVFPPPRVAIGKNSFQVGDVYVAPLEGIQARAGWKYVISAMIHTAEPWGDPTEESVKASTKKALQEAHQRNLTSITFPAFGTGILGMDFTVSARSMYIGIQEFLKENPQTSLRDIKVVLFDQEGLAPFRQELTRLSSSPIILEANAGEHLEHFAARMIALQIETERLVQGEFNGITLKATGKETAQDIVKKFKEGMKNRRKEAEAWKATPEGQEYLGQEAERKVLKQRRLTEAKAKYAQMKQDIFNGNDRTKATVEIFNEDWGYISLWAGKIKGTVSVNLAENPNAVNVHEVKNVDANMKFLFGPTGTGGRFGINDQEVAAAIQEALWADLEDHFQALKKNTTPSDIGSSPVGGIDLNPANLDLQIKRDGNGVPLPVEFQDIPNINVNGFIPVIINITPVTNLPLLLGTNTNPQEQQLSSIQ